MSTDRTAQLAAEDEAAGIDLGQTPIIVTEHRFIIPVLATGVGILSWLLRGSGGSKEATLPMFTSCPDPTAGIVKFK